MTTEEAFAELTSQRNWYKKTGLSKNTANSLASRAQAGGSITKRKMEEVLELAGYRVIVEKQWGQPVPEVGPDGVHQSWIDQYKDDQEKN